MKFEKSCDEKVDVVRKLSELAQTNPEYNATLNKEVTKLIYFLEMLPETVKGASILAIYGGESGYGCNEKTAVNEGVDFIEKYVDGGLVLREEYGTKDFYGTYRDYFDNHIKPKQRLMGGNTTAKVITKDL